MASAVLTCAPQPLRVFLAEDFAPIRARIADLLPLGDMAVVGEGATPQQCVEGIVASRPDVVVLDVQLEGGSGLQVMSAVREQAPATAFVVFTNSTLPAYRKRYLAAGASAFLDKTHDFGRLVHAIAQARPDLPSQRSIP
jgi:two-component system response regulator DesR